MAPSPQKGTSVGDCATSAGVQRPPAELGWVVVAEHTPGERRVGAGALGEPEQRHVHARPGRVGDIPKGCDSIEPQALKALTFARGEPFASVLERKRCRRSIGPGFAVRIDAEAGGDAQKGSFVVASPTPALRASTDARAGRGRRFLPRSLAFARHERRRREHGACQEGPAESPPRAKVGSAGSLHPAPGLATNAWSANRLCRGPESTISPKGSAPPTLAPPRKCCEAAHALRKRVPGHLPFRRPSALETPTEVPRCPTRPTYCAAHSLLRWARDSPCELPLLSKRRICRPPQSCTARPCTARPCSVVWRSVRPKGRPRGRPPRRTEPPDAKRRKRRARCVASPCSSSWRWSRSSRS